MNQKFRQLLFSGLLDQDVKVSVRQRESSFGGEPEDEVSLGFHQVQAVALRGQAQQPRTGVDEGRLLVGRHLVIVGLKVDLKTKRQN